MKRKLSIIILTIMSMLIFTSCADIDTISKNLDGINSKGYVSAISSSEEIQHYPTINEVGDFTGTPYAIINDNKPEFTVVTYSNSFEEYGRLDKLGRCTSCIANIGQDIMPTEKRGEIGSVKPTGWKTAKYDNVDGHYLYNRCHLIGYQLTAENANERNLITGTRYMNVDGMLPFEDEVAGYVKKTNNHVLYRVTPIFKGNELVARGVQMEAYSVEDCGQGVEFNVFCYNAQPDIAINYANGDSKFVGTSTTQSSSKKQTFIVNTNTRKFHYPSCSSVSSTKQTNKKSYTGYRDNLIKNGYEPCNNCKP